MTDDELIEKYIWLPEHTTWPTEARIAGHWQHVWALIGSIDHAEHGACEIAEGYDLPLEAAEAALAYYRRHKEVFDTRLAELASYV